MMANRRPGGRAETTGSVLVGLALALGLAGGSAVLLGASGARAQMQLSGANNGIATDKPSVDKGGTGGDPAYVQAKPIVIKPPGTEAIAGQALMHDGKNGTMTFDQSGDELVLSKLVFVGGKISKPGQACSVEVSLVPPLTATPDGRPVGALRYSVPLEACPFDIDVLDGAVLVTNPTPSCDFTAADCRVSPGGLWGPTAAEITPQRAKDLERERVRIETTMRTDFRALLKKAGKDKAAVKAIAGEQAGFSSDREVACRDYAQESVHGFCSTRVTQARVLALIAKFGDSPDHRQHASKPKTKPKLVPMAAPVVRAAPPQ